MWGGQVKDWRKGDESVDHVRHQIALGYIASPLSQNTAALTVSPIAELGKVRLKKFREVRRDAPGHTATLLVADMELSFTSVGPQGFLPCYGMHSIELNFKQVPDGYPVHFLD